MCTNNQTPQNNHIPFLQIRFITGQVNGYLMERIRLNEFVSISFSKGRTTLTFYRLRKPINLNVFVSDLTELHYKCVYCQITGKGESFDLFVPISEQVHYLNIHFRTMLHLFGSASVSFVPALPAS